MILLTKLDGTEFALNCDLIETVYENPDTTIHLTTGRIYIVKESMEDVIKKAALYHKQIFSDAVNQRF